MADEIDRPRESESGPLEKRLVKSLADIKDDAEVMIDQRDEAHEDLCFVNKVGGMWEGSRLESEYKDRAKMEFDLISNHLFRFMGEWNQNRMGVEYRPDDSNTSDDDAELLNGIHRADFRDGAGKPSIDNAVYETSNCGYGAFKLAPKFDNEEDPEDERQRIEWRPINSAFDRVYWDSAATYADKRDARWCTVLTQFTEDGFDEAFNKKGKDEIKLKPRSAYTPNSNRDNNFYNNRGAGKNKAVYVATRYEVVRKKEQAFMYSNFLSNEVEVYSEAEHEVYRDELKVDKNRKFKGQRQVLRQTVEKSVFSGDDYLEEPRRIAGKWIPIIPMYGHRTYVDGAEWYFGLVRKLKDASRLFNMHMNQIAENAASNGQAVPIFDPDQMPANISALWADKNNLPYLLAKALRDDNGKIVQMGPTAYLQPGTIDQNTAASMQAVMQFVSDQIGGVPQDTLDPNASGKAIRAMIKRENLNTQPMQDNIKAAIEWSGVVYQSMASEVYSKPQIVRTLGLDGTEGREQLMKTVMDEQTGQLIQANDLRGKRFRAYSDVGPQYESLREETVETLKTMGTFLKETPDGAQYLGPLIFTMLDSMEGVGLGPLKDINRKNMILKGLKKPETDEEKALVKQAQQPKEDPNAKLLEGLTKQATAEATKFESQARNLDSGSIKNIADSRKKQAETAKIISETQDGRAKTLAELRKQAFETAEGLPFGEQ